MADQAIRPAKRKNIEVQRDYRARRQTHLQELEVEVVLLRQRVARLDRENAALREENAVLRGQGGHDAKGEGARTASACRDEEGAAGLLCCLRTSAAPTSAQGAGNCASAPVRASEPDMVSVWTRLLVSCGADETPLPWPAEALGTIDNRDDRARCARNFSQRFSCSYNGASIKYRRLSFSAFVTTAARGECRRTCVAAILRFRSERLTFRRPPDR